MNKVFLIGRTTKDVELRRTTSGTSVATFTLAIDNRFAKDEEKTNFINCVAWKNQAEFMDKYIKKGSLIGISGRIQTRNYDDKDGKRVYVTEIVVEELQSLESKKDKEEANNETYYKPSQNQATSNDAITYDISDDDLPF